jgi:hypothetical protein
VETDQREFRPALLAIALFAALSLYCGLRSEGFIAADACTHYLAARYAWQSPINFVDVWNRPLVTLLYAGPAWIGGRAAVRALCMVVAVGCGLVGWSIARGQGLKQPVLALIFTLGQPLLFLHSFDAMTELPFALVLGLAFLAWQKKQYWLAAALVAWTPLARPEGFGFVAMTAFGLLVSGKWWPIVLLPMPIILWDLAGWQITGHSHPWWRWLIDSWPYSEQSLYGRGYLLTFVALMPAVVSPIVLPAVIVGVCRSFVPAPLADTTVKPRPPGRTLQILGNHKSLCIFLTAAIPMFVLIVHSLLYWRGKMASFGEPRYMLVVAPFWGVLAARGWQFVWDRLHWQHALRWAGGAVMLPIAINMIHPAVPIGLPHDWESARQMARWYQDRYGAAGADRVIAGHPGVVYFLGVNPRRLPAIGPNSLKFAPPGTVMIWDPIFSAVNASSDCALSLDQIRQAGWQEIATAPDLYEPNPDAITRKIRDPADQKSHWHVFMRIAG